MRYCVFNMTEWTSVLNNDGSKEVGKNRETTYGLPQSIAQKG